MPTPDEAANGHAPTLDETMLDAPTIDEQSNHCFACGPHNPQGLHLAFTTDAHHPGHIRATATVQLPRAYQGAPGFLHGGIIATLLDEAMSKLNRPLNVLAMTRHMEVDYLRPAPVDTPLTLSAVHLRREGRKLFHSAELSLSDGTALARARAVFIVLDRERVQAHLEAAHKSA